MMRTNPYNIQYSLIEQSAAVFAIVLNVCTQWPKTMHTNLCLQSVSLLISA